MAATAQAYLERIPGSSLVNAYPQVSPNAVGNQNLDLIQFVDQGDNIVLNVTSAGVVHNPAVNATNGTRLGQFYTRLASTATTAQFFADVFEPNTNNSDILQVVNIGGNISYYLNYLGVATGS